MLLCRSPKAALAYDPPLYVSLNRTRVTVEEFRAGKLDDAILELFGLKALVEALARCALAERGEAVASLETEHAERPRVQRTWSFGRADPRAVAIRGRTISARAGEATYEASFDVHAKAGFPAALAEALGADLVTAVHAAAVALSPWPCMCHTGVEEMSQHGTLDTLASKYDPRAPVDVGAAVARCTVCNQGWTFEWHGDSHYDYSYSASEFVQRPAFSDEEVRLILADLRAGYRVDVPKARGNTQFLSLTDGTFRMDESEDNSGTETPLTEWQMRWYIANDPGSFTDVLRKPGRQALREALYAAVTPETRAAARARLDELLVYGPCLTDANLIDAVLAWPEETPAIELLNDKSGLDVYHAIMSAVGYASTNADTGAFGLRVFAAVSEMRADVPQLRRYRASFHALKGDYAAAMEDLQWAVDHGEDAADELARTWRKYTLAEFNVPDEDATLEALLRSEKCGPPAPPDSDPWDFVFRWPDRVLLERVWPIANRLLVDDDINVRGRALEFVRHWDKGRALTTPRLLEVAETNADLYEAQMDQWVTLRAELAWTLENVSVDVDRPRILAIARRLAANEPLCASRLGTYDPDFVIGRIKDWGENNASWYAEAAGPLATFHRDRVLEFLTACRDFARSGRRHILENTQEGIRDDETSIRMTTSYNLAPPAKPAPTAEEMKRAIDL